MTGTTTEDTGTGRQTHDLSDRRSDGTRPSRPNLPESRRYRIKRVLSRPPLAVKLNDLHGQRLGKPTALAGLSSDVMSSSAYATEQMLRLLVPSAGWPRSR